VSGGDRLAALTLVPPDVSEFPRAGRRSGGVISTMPKDASLDRVPVSLTPLERFEEYLRSRGMRSTEQRRVLVEYVFSQHDHFDADSLIEKLPRRGQPHYVSRPTVYRTLAEFVDAGLLHKFELDGRAVYEHDYGYPQHDHLYCQNCQRLIEFQSDELITLRDEVARTHRFRVAGHRLIIRGVCEACQQAQRKRTRRRQDRL
jgi:Fur family ferric uptake transcriptional regulator